MLRITEIRNELAKSKPYIKSISTYSSKAEVLKWFSNLTKAQQKAIKNSSANREIDEPANDFLLRVYVRRMLKDYSLEEPSPVYVSIPDFQDGDIDVTDLDLISDEELDEMFADQLDEDGNWLEDVEGENEES